MTGATAARGWCPTARRPMPSGDGLIVRVRPPGGRLTAAEALALADAAEAHGDGSVALTSRANIQVRGVAPAAYPALLADLLAHGLASGDAAGDAAGDARPGVVVAPLWRERDATQTLAADLERRLAAIPGLPAKFGFAVDAGAAPCLSNVSADVRIERAATGGLIVRADGAATGRAVTPETAVDAALALAGWFARNGGAGAGRMRRLLADTPPPATWTGAPPADPAPPLRPGPSEIGPVVGAPFGEAPAAALKSLIARSGARALRIAPWRLLVLEDGVDVDLPPFIRDAGDPLLGVDACPGAPACASATVETRGFARRLAAAGVADLHVSGCAKGCARNAPAGVTLVGRDGRFDLVRGGDAGAPPIRAGLSPDAVMAELELR